MIKNVSVPEGYKKTGLGVFPEEWEVEELGTCIKQVKESVLPESTGKTIYVGLEHISSGETKLTNYGRSDSVKSLKFKFTKNNILYGKLRPYLDKAVLTDKEGICSTDIIVIECRDSSIKEFVIYILHSKQFLDYINGTTAGSNLPRTSWQSISKYKVPLPPFSEQQKIASILSKVDEQIEQTEQIIEKTELLKKGLMQKLLTKGIGHTEFKKTELGEIPEEWKVTSLDKLAKIRRGASPRPIGDKKYFSESGGRGWVRISDVTNAYKYLRVASQYLSELGSSKSVPVDKGDLIMSICATIGKPIIVDMSACIHDGFVLFSNLNEKIDTEFLFYVLSKTEQEFLKKKQSGTQGNLNTTIVGKTKITMPNTIEEQQKIASILSKVDSQIQDNQKYLTRLQELKKGLMQDLLTGKVRVCV